MKDENLNLKRDIASREDLMLIVKSFYDILKQEADVGNFFIRGVNDWEKHLGYVVDYWESRVLFSQAYEKSVLPIHIDIDNRFGNKFEPKHFEEWLLFWNRCIDLHFEGDRTKHTKEVARKMAQNIYKKMFIGRHSPVWDDIVKNSNKE